VSLEAHQIVGKHRLHNCTSEIGIRFGAVYILNDGGINERMWYLSNENDIEWVHSFREEHELPEGEEHFIGYKFTAKTDSLLKRLLGLDWNADSESFKRAFTSNPDAKNWVKNLRLAQDRLNYWYAQGCPLNNEELAILEEWNQYDFKNPKKDFRKHLANHILSVRHRAKKMEQEHESASKPKKGTGE